MKSLKRMLLINWYDINKQMIEFENINFLTGKNASGKSTILDALQLLILGDTRGNFFNKAANEKTDRTLEGYLKCEIGEDGDNGYQYKRNGRFSSYIVCEFFDQVSQKSFLLGVVFDVYKDSDIENHFFSFQGKIPENEFVGDNQIPFSYQDLKSKYKNFEFYSSQKQYQDSMRGKLGGLNQKFFNLFKKAVTFTPIIDIEKFIVEYVCDVKNEIDITSMQENIRQYNSLCKQVEIMKNKQNELQTIEDIYLQYGEEVAKELEEQYFIFRAEKESLIKEKDELDKQIEKKKIEQQALKKQTQELEDDKNKLGEEITGLIEIRAKSDIEIKRKEILGKLDRLKEEIERIEGLESKSIRLFRNHSLRWNANLFELETIQNKIVATPLEDLSGFVDLLKYLEHIHENNFSSLEITAVKQIKEKVEELIKFGNTVFFATQNEFQKDGDTKRELERDIEKLNKGRPYEQELLNFKEQLETRLKQKKGREISVAILADLLEIKNPRWQNAIEGYLNTQKKYFIIEPEFFEQASQIYRELAKENPKIHSFGIVDIDKIQKENRLEPKNDSLAMEIMTENELARVYIDYLLGNVIKCETIEELRKNKISITPDGMLYQGYVLRKINPKVYQYPIIGKQALEKHKQMKEKELVQLKEKIASQEKILQVMGNLKQMSNFSEDEILNFEDYIKQAQKKEQYIVEQQALEKELDGMDLVWLNTISEQIQQKENIKFEKERFIKENSTQIGGLQDAIQRMEQETKPNLNQQIEAKDKQIDENYSKEWQEMEEEKYGIQALKKTPEKIVETFLRHRNHTKIKQEQIKTDLVNKRSDYNTKYQLSYPIQGDNHEFSEELRKLKEIALPEYLEKIQDAKQKAYEQFRIEFLDKLKSNMDEVKVQIKELNDALGQHRFGTDTYSFKVSPKQEYRRFYDMLQDELLLGDWLIGQEQFNQKYAQEIKELFDKITTIDHFASEEYEKNIKEYTDYRTYLNFDLMVKDKLGNQQRLSKTLLKKSGGETQTPFYISILASFAQVYRIKKQDNTIRLIVFDEAFSKMDPERIEESIKLLRTIGFQAIFAAPPDKLQDIQELVDASFLVVNPEEHQVLVKKYSNPKK